MTKEEYQKLLQSDYWKGYSYSLIKERDFTCEDCGRWFYNESDKLHVHHLVHRDVNPWSYNPDEVVVLCEDCHKKRHGLFVAPRQDTTDSQSPFGDDGNGFPFADFDVKAPFVNDSDIEKIFASWKAGPYENARSPYPIEPEPKSGFKFIYVLYGVLLFLCIMIGKELFFSSKSVSGNRPSYEEVGKSAERTASEVPLETAESAAAMQAERAASRAVDEEESEKETSRELSTSEILERKTHARVVKQAQRAGVSTEGTTSEILERITRKKMEKYNY